MLTFSVLLVHRDNLQLKLQQGFQKVTYLSKWHQAGFGREQPVVLTGEAGCVNPSQATKLCLRVTGMPF